MRPPRLEPETDVSYQASLQHLFTPDVYGQFSLFFRDIFGLLTVRPERDAAGNQVSVWSNGDYASYRGFEMSLTRAFAHHFSADVAYTYCRSLEMLLLTDLQGFMANPFASLLWNVASWRRG